MLAITKSNGASTKIQPKSSSRILSMVKSGANGVLKWVRTTVGCHSLCNVESMNHIDINSHN